jgi:hypothetical protein
MKLFGTTAFAALVAGSVPALALDLGSGFTVSGDVELEYSADEIGNEGSTAFIDATLGWRSQAGGSIGFGFVLDLVGMESFGAGFSASAITGGLVLTTEFGEFTVGNPRPLLSTMIDTPMIGGLRTYDVQLENLSGSTLEFLNLTTDEVDIYGASFKGSAGAITYGISYHTVEEIDGSRIVELAATYQLGKALIQAGMEAVDINPIGEIDKHFLGATYVEDRWSAGLMLTFFEQSAVKIRTTRLFGDYEVSDAFKVGAQALNFEIGGTSGTSYGLTGEYGFGSGGFAELGSLFSSGGDDAIYQVSIGYRF